MSILKTVNLKKYYGIEESLVKALDGIDFEVNEGEFVAVVGASGSGKSTLLNMIGGLDSPSEGSIFINSQDISNMFDEELTILRRRQIGFVFQNFNLIPMLSVYENIVLPVFLDGSKPDQIYIDEIMDVLQITGKKDRFPTQLSGGQQQRVAIARALAAKPAIILADEPTGNLDTINSKEVLGLLKMTAAKFGQTIVMITHNPEIAQLADRIVHITDGKIYKDYDGVENEK